MATKESTHVQQLFHKLPTVFPFILIFVAQQTLHEPNEKDCKVRNIFMQMRTAPFRLSFNSKNHKNFPVPRKQFSATVFSICIFFRFQRGKPIFVVWAYPSTSDVQPIEQEVRRKQRELFYSKCSYSTVLEAFSK